MNRKNGKKLLIAIAVGAVVVKAVRDVIKAKKQEEVNNPVSVSLLSGNRKPQIRF